MMNKSELNKLSKKRLIDLLLKDQQKSKNLFQHLVKVLNKWYMIVGKI